MWRTARPKPGTRSYMRWTRRLATCCLRARTQFRDSRTSARSLLVAAASMWAPRMGRCMRFAWAFQNRKLAALLFVAARLAPGQTSIFDGKTLKGWDGDPAYWRVEN